MIEQDECTCNECKPISFIIPSLSDVTIEFLRRRYNGETTTWEDLYNWLFSKSKLILPNEYEIKTCVNKVIDKWQNDNGIILTDDLSLKITKEILSLYNVSHETIR